MSSSGVPEDTSAFSELTRILLNGILPHEGSKELVSCKSATLYLYLSGYIMILPLAGCL